eukprot:66021-Chlamydomonas_euryale.AAC.1
MTLTYGGQSSVLRKRLRTPSPPQSICRCFPRTHANPSTAQAPTASTTCWAARAALARPAARAAWRYALRRRGCRRSSCPPTLRTR